MVGPRKEYGYLPNENPYCVCQGIRMMQSQIHLKKAGQTAKSRELASKNRSAVLAPVMELNKKQKKDDKSDDFKARYVHLDPGSW